MPANSWTRHRFSFPAFQALFDSGNTPRPPEGFEGLDHYREFIAEKEFRGAINLFDVRIRIGAQGPPQLEYQHHEEVGFTPMRFVINWAVIGNPKFTGWYSRGVGDGGILEIVEGDCARLQQFLRFKIGKVGDLGSWVMTGQFAPSAWMQTDSRVCRDGTVSIKFYGTFVPSQKNYVDYARVVHFNMLENTEAQIDAFLFAGTCLDAPGALRHEQSQAARECE